jgi:PknH-like extracellular domain
MSDMSQGDGWWQASDLKWYPPEKRPDPAALPPPPDQQPQRPSPGQPPGGGPPPQPAPPQQPAEPTQHAPEPLGQQPAGPPPWQPAPHGNRDQWLVLGIVAALVVAAALAGAGIYIATKKSNKPAASSSTTPTTTTPAGPPVAEAALEGLLLSPDQINTAMGATGMTISVPPNPTVMWDESAFLPDKACVPLWGPAERLAYAGSASGAVHGQMLGEPTHNVLPSHNVLQYVVLFSSAHDADAFFTASAQRWPACSNRQYTHTFGGGAVWTVGPVSNTNGILSATETADVTTNVGNVSPTCQRALTVANNVAIDVAACTTNRSDSPSGAAVNIAQQIAAKGLLLSPDQINSAVGATGMTLTGPEYPTSTWDDSNEVTDKACLPIDAPAEADAYSGSGWSSLYGQELGEQPGDKWTHLVTQVVVLFPSARDAEAFFTASAQRWPACSNRQYTFSDDASKPDQVHTVGPVSNTNGTLSATVTWAGSTWSWATCQRALTVANNVAIDVRACSHNRSDSQSDAAVNIAHQIAAKVPTT